MKAKADVNVDLSFTIRVADSKKKESSFFLVAKIRCSGQVFGRDPASLPTTEDEGLEVTYLPV